jgi:hypothetical protein
MSGGSAVLALPESNDDSEVVVSRKRVPTKTRKILVEDDEPYVAPRFDIAQLQIEDSLRQQGATEEQIANMREMIRRRANKPEPMG